MATILVVDSRPEEARNVRVRLTREGHEVFSAAEGPSGLLAAFTHRPDLVILDALTPRTDGFATLRCMLREMKNDERTTHVPVVLLVAEADLSAVRETPDGGSPDVSDYVLKPFDVEEVASCVGKVLTDRGVTYPAAIWPLFG